MFFGCRGGLRVCLAGVLLACGGSGPGTQEKAATGPKEKREPAVDLVLRGGVVWTADEAKPSAQAVAVDEGKIVVVGTDAEVEPYIGRETRVIDLGGAFLQPGFNDNHVHFANAAAFLEFNVMKVSGQTEFEDRVEEVIENLPDGDWLLGGLWGAYDQWTEGSAGGARREPFRPDMRPLEALSAKKPIFIRKFDDSEFGANRAALVAAGLDPDAPKARGVEFLRDEKGLTGIMRGEGVLPLFEKVVPAEFSRDRRVMQTRRALAEVARYGVTNFSDMSDDEQLEIYRQLHADGQLTSRVHFRYHLERYEELAKQGIKVGHGDEWIRLGGLKGHIDGIMGASTARFFEPYTHQPDNRGKWRRLMVDEKGEFAPGKFLGYMLGADAAGMQLTVHAIGDEANHLLLNYLEELAAKNGEKDRRFRLVHAQVIAEKDMPRLGKLGVVAEIQPFHLSDDMRWMAERIGEERCKGAYAFRSIVDSGAVLSFGTDWPGTAAAEYPINPMLGLYAAVTRQTLAGEPAEGWYPDQRISIEEALRAYTIGTAYANFEEQQKGSITVGKLADLTVMDRNLLEVPSKELLEAQVLYTIVDGKIVYERPKSAARD